MFGSSSISYLASSSQPFSSRPSPHHRNVSTLQLYFYTTPVEVRSAYLDVVRAQVLPTAGPDQPRYLLLARPRAALIASVQQKLWDLT